MAHAECTCTSEDARFWCEAIRRWQTQRQREQCRASQAFRDGFAALPPQRPPGEEPALPSLARRAVNYTKAQAKHTAKGRPKASAELKAARLAVCEGTAEAGHCRHYRPSDQTCAASPKCGCYVGPKAGWLDQDCPLGLWPTAAASSCVVCGKPATTICSYGTSLGLCGEPLCGGCTHRHIL